MSKMDHDDRDGEGPWQWRGSVWRRGRWRRGAGAAPAAAHPLGPLTASEARIHLPDVREVQDRISPTTCVAAGTDTAGTSAPPAGGRKRAQFDPTRDAIMYAIPPALLLPPPPLRSGSVGAGPPETISLPRLKPLFQSAPPGRSTPPPTVPAP
ncbi:hypothetical protein ACHAWF_014354 [Thalassiosira exigua]